jgi:hypothetical protein
VNHHLPAEPDMSTVLELESEVVEEEALGSAVAVEGAA